MRVVLVNRFATRRGGAEKHAVGLARILRARGDQVRFLSTVSEDGAEHQGAFVPLRATDFWRGRPEGRDRIAVAGAAIWNRQAAAAMERLVDDFRPDLVHAHDLYPQLSAAPVCVAARRGVPIAQTLHNYELISASPLDERGGWRDRGGGTAAVRALRTVLCLARRRLHVPHVGLWIAVSGYVAGAYERRGIRAEVVPNFTEPPGGEPAGFSERSGIVFAGRLAPEKGVIDAIALARRLPEVPVVIAGRGPLEGEAADAATELSNLEFAGELSPDEIDGRLRTARLAIVPSRWQEPAGLVALEAFAQGTPVVAYDVGGLAEYVRAAGGGVVVPPRAAALAAASADLYADEGSWSQAATAGRKAVAATHSPATYGDRIAALYRGLIDAR